MTQRFSDTVMEHFLEPRNQGVLTNSTATGISGCPGRGPFVIFQIECTDGYILKARFQSHLCGVTVACGSILTELVENRTFDQCESITCNDLAKSLDGIPPDKLHVPVFVLGALKQAISEARNQ